VLILHNCTSKQPVLA